MTKDYEAITIGLVCDSGVDAFIPMGTVEPSELERKVKLLVELGCNRVRLVVDIHAQKTLMVWDVDEGGGR